MVEQYIWINDGTRKKKKLYYLYKSYKHGTQARKKGKEIGKRYKAKYFIIEGEDGFWFPENKWRLYFDKCIKIW